MRGICILKLHVLFVLLLHGLESLLYRFQRLVSWCSNSSAAGLELAVSWGIQETLNPSHCSKTAQSISPERSIPLSHLLGLSWHLAEGGVV